MAKKKKSAPSNPARGFATTSMPSKPKQTILAVPPPPKPPTPPPAAPEPEWQPPTAEEEAEREFQAILEKYGPRVRREAQRIVVKAETEKRTLRTSAMYYPLKLDKVFGIDSERATGNVEGAEETLGEKVLKMARREYQTAAEGFPTVREPGEALMTAAWTLHRVMIGLGLRSKVVEDAIKAVLGRQRKGTLETENLLEQVLEWIMLFAESEDLPRFLDTVTGVQKKGTPSASGTSTPAMIPEPSVADTRHHILPSRETSKPLPPPPEKQSLNFESSIPNIALETKDISDQGEDLCSSDASESEFEDEELTPENMIPKYLEIQTKLYKIHPTVASTVTGGKKAKGGGRKPTKVQPAPPPTHLSEAEKKKVKSFHQKLIEIERDPLFDAYEADTAWRDQRATLEADGWEKKKTRRRSKKTNPSQGAQLSVVGSPKPTPAGEEDDDSLMGGLFDGPPTEEASSAGENITIRDFEDAPTSIMTSKLAKKSGQGKPGVAAQALRKLVQEICKSRDINAKVKFEEIPGTSISNRCRLTISWTLVPELEASPPFTSADDAPDVIITTPNDKTSVFEMKKIAAITKDQAEGYIVTYALFKLYAKKEEKLYLRLPTIWRNLWAELVELDRNRSETEEKKVLERLKSLFEQSNEADKVDASRVSLPPKTIQTSAPPEDSKPYQPAHERFLESEALMEDWARRRNTPAFQKMEAHRSSLPMWSFRNEIIKAVENSPVVVLCGETGCGKSTQLPAFLMEHELSQGRMCKIYCTEPRRISALSLAKRVAEEMGEGKRVGGLVGYSIRLENMVSDKTRLVYATTGIVMRMLERSRELEGITHLVLDEVHERSIESDFLLVVLKRLLVKRKDLKVVLMSATVNAEKFSSYLNGAPILHVPGRTFPVQPYFLEDAVELTNFVLEDDPRRRRNGRNDWEDELNDDFDVNSSINTASFNNQNYKSSTLSTISRLHPYRIPFDLTVTLLSFIATSPDYTDFSHAILVFLPGLAEIRRLNDILLSHPTFSRNWLIYPLHSTLTSESQEAVFNIPPPGYRKIVLATNIAETGITIPDITAVVDTGKHKEMRFDEKRQISRLLETFISRANAKQRRGRAGRVRPGICFHLFTRDAFETRFAEDQTPEMLRLSLQDLVLRVKTCDLGGIEDVLLSALDPPSRKNILRAIENLIEARALTPNEELTKLGRNLSLLPLDVYLGKLILLSTNPLFRTVDAAVTIAAILSSKSPFTSPIGYSTEAANARKSFTKGDSDLTTAYNAYTIWRRLCTAPSNITEPDWCRKNYISSRNLSAIEDLKMQLFASLADAGFLKLTNDESAALSRARYSGSSLPPTRRCFFFPPEEYDTNSTSEAMVAANVAMAFHPHLLLRAQSGAFHPITNPALVIRPHRGNTHNAEWLTYYSLLQTSASGRKEAHETTRVEPVVVAVGCGEVEWKHWAGVGVLDGRVRVGVRGGREGVVVEAVRRWVRECVEGGKRVEGLEEVWRLVVERSWVERR